MSDRDFDSVLDLSARARRGLLSATEEATLKDALGRDPTLGVAHQVGLDVDWSTAVRVGDEALIARAADLALERVRVSGLSTDPHQQQAPGRPSRLPSRRRRLAALVAAALVCATGMAAGMWATGMPARWFAPNVARVERPSIPVVAREPETPPSAPAVTAAKPTDEDVDPTPATETSTNATSRERRASRSVPEAKAQALFKSANSARRDGDFSSAERLYSQLIGRYPSSDEAGLARVSLGKLLLASGDPSDAEREFGQYLQHSKSGGGQLAEEALVSRGESFEKLGSAKAERATWQRLLAEYPTSVYAAEARRRLDALAKDGM